MFIGWLTAFTDNEFGEKGSTLLEYSLLGALLAMVIVVSVSLAGQESQSIFFEVGHAMAGKDAPTDPGTF